ncbi:hypothetical protein VTI28DRAFT_7412 [Corynascus sepedonium]
MLPSCDHQLADWLRTRSGLGTLIVLRQPAATWHLRSGALPHSRLRKHLDCDHVCHRSFRSRRQDSSSAWCFVRDSCAGHRATDRADRNQRACSQKRRVCRCRCKGAASRRARSGTCYFSWLPDSGHNSSTISGRSAKERMWNITAGGFCSFSTRRHTRSDI